MMNVIKTALATVAILLALAACGSPKTDTAATVDWSNYSTATHDRIESAIKAKDCTALQGEFDTASSHKSTDLMTYLDGAMDTAGCYK